MWTCEAGGGTLRALRYLRTGGGAQPKAECLLNGSSPVTRVKQQRRTWRRCDVNARDWTRTSTPLRALAPQASASTNSATRAPRGKPTVSGDSHILHPRVKGVAQPVAQVVDREDRDEDTEPGENRGPGRNRHVRLGVGQHIPPRRGRRLDSEAEKGERRLDRKSV